MTSPFYIAPTYQANSGYSYFNNPGAAGDVMDGNTATYVEQSGAIGGVVGYSLLFQLASGQTFDHFTALFSAEDVPNAVLEVSTNLAYAGGTSFSGTWSTVAFSTPGGLIPGMGTYTAYSLVATITSPISTGSNTWIRFSLKNTDTSGVATKVRLADSQPKHNTTLLTVITPNLFGSIVLWRQRQSVYAGFPIGGRVIG